MKKIAFLKPIFSFLFIGLLITTLSRFFLFFLYQERVIQTPNYWFVFPIGLRMDIIVFSYILFLPTLLICLLPDTFLKKISGFLTLYFVFFLSLILFLELVTPNFIGQYDTRPNQLFIEYLIYPKEVLQLLYKGYLLSIIAVFSIISVFIYVLTKNRIKLFGTVSSVYKTKLIVFPLILFLLFFGARSSLTSRRPINSSNAVFSTDQLTNCLGLNSFYTLAFAFYSIKNEGNCNKIYGKMNPDEAISRVKKYMNVSNSDFTDKELPLLHNQYSDTMLKKPYNIVIILEESLGAEYVGCLEGLKLTPEFDKLAKEGLLFTNLYSTGTRSVRGIEAVVTGFLPSPSESVVKLNNSQTDFYTIASLLKKRGYDTSFIYGGMNNFDNMGSFFNGNGFNHLIDEDNFDSKKSVFHGTWGWCDEDVMQKANTYFTSLKTKPFVSLIFSSSNHEPFEYPEGRIKLYDKQKNTVKNAMKYADYSIGKFFEMAKKEDYYKNTIFIIIADHNTRTYGKHLVPIHKFHIPALIIGPGFPKGEKYTKLCSQIDIQPTFLSKIGMNLCTPMPGRNLLALPENVKGRSIMQFNDINAFRVDNQVVIMQPNKNPLQFKVEKDTVFTPVTLNKELAKDALAHVITASYLYKNKKYRSQ